MFVSSAPSFFLKKEIGEEPFLCLKDSDIQVTEQPFQFATWKNGFFDMVYSGMNREIVGS